MWSTYDANDLADAPFLFRQLFQLSLRCDYAYLKHFSKRQVIMGASKLKALVLIVVLNLLFSFASGTSAPVDLSKFVAGVDGTRFTGIGTFTVAQIGDHNGDGFADIILGSYALNRAVIVMRTKEVTTQDVYTPSVVSDEYFRVITGPSSSNLGGSVGGVGDINGDGFDDVIIGAGNGKTDRGFVGYAFVIFGKKGPFTDVVVTATWPATSVGFMLLGPVQFMSLVAFSESARGLGDVNGDGVDDFAVSARNYKGTSSKSFAGVVWVIFGKKSTAFNTIDLLLVPDNFGSNGIYFTGEFGSDSLGDAIAPAGDFNGDGIPDFLMSANNYDSPPVGSQPRTNSGAVYLIHGSKTALATMDMSTFVTGTMGVRFLGAVNSDSLGRSVSGVGDINGDGVDDIAFGAPNADPLSRDTGGIVYVIYGTRVAFTADVDLANFAASPASLVGFAIYGQATTFRLCTVAAAGDINQDGVNDILVGGFRSSPNSRAHVVFGQIGARTAPVDTLVDDVITFNVTGGTYLGSVLDGGKDLNDDGVSDILVTGVLSSLTPEGGGAPISNAGVVWMLSGATLDPAVPTVAPTSNQSPAPTVGPTLNPTIDPSAPPTLPPSLAPSMPPTLSPTLDPTRAPTNNPTLDPTMSPTLNPTVTPTVVPSAVPSITPSQDPSMSPTLAPTAPTVDPTLAPSVVPSMDPSMTPSVAPSLTPSVDPTVNPSVTPTMLPSVVPSMDPTVHPTLAPTLAPTAAPSVHPTASPTAGPTLVPTASPSASPTVSPTVAPTIAPTTTPTKVPTVAPSSAPTVAPTARPSVSPTADPTAMPSITPTAAPSKSPTVSPTATPTMLPTVSPSAVPTARPTVPAVKDYEVVVDVNQEVTGMTQADYDAQKAAYNSTIQHAVADATDGVVPDRVTDIAVEEEEEEEGRVGKNMRATTTVFAANSVRFRYRITVRDPAVTVKTLRAQLVQAAQEGKMDTALRTYAVQFGAPGLRNATVAEPQVSSILVQRDASSQLTGVQIALLVSGVLVGLVLLASIVWIALSHKQPGLDETAGVRMGNDHMDLVM